MLCKITFFNGKQHFKMAHLSLTPFGKEVILNF